MVKCRRYLVVHHLVLLNPFKYCKLLFYFNLKCLNLKQCDINLLIKFHFMYKNLNNENPPKKCNWKNPAFNMQC